MMKKAFIADSKATSAGHTLTFLANSGEKMLDNGLTVDLDTLNVPLVGGEFKLLNDLQAADRLAVPLMTDHDFDLDSQAGTITRLWRTDEGLMAEATLSGVKAGQQVMQLAVDGALTNSFSITIDFDDQPDEDGIIRNSRLVEISVVFKGADEKAAFRSINRKGSKMQVNLDKFKSVNDVTTYVESLAISDADKKDLISKLTDALTETITDVVNGKPADDAAPADAPADDSGDGDNGGTPPATPTQNAHKKGVSLGMGNIIINHGNAPKARQGFAHIKDTRKSWLDTREAYFAYEKALRDDTTGDGKEFAQKWNSFAKAELEKRGSFGVDADSVTTLVPTAVATEIADVYNNGGSGLWQMLNKTGLDQLTLTRNNIGLDQDEGRAHGYPVADYGKEKSEEKISLLKRVLSPEYTYKYLTVNKGDLRRTQKPGALLKYITSELPSRLINTIEHAVIFDDWEDMAHFRSVLADSKDKTSTDWQGSEFALTQSAGADETLLETFIRASSLVRANGAKVLITNPKTVADLTLAKGSDGHTLLPLGSGTLAATLGVSQIITPEWWFDDNDADAAGVIMVPSNYSVVGDTSIEAFTNFALKTNTNEFLQELFAGGGLSAIRSAAVVAPVSES